MGKQVVRICSIVGAVLLVFTILWIAIVNLIASTATLLHILHFK